MIESLIIGIIIILIVYPTKSRKFKYGIEAAFIVLATFVALRYNWGNDYAGYLEDFHRINSYLQKSDAYLDTHSELGWIFLNRLFKPIGFFGFTIVLTFFEYYVLYRFVKRYVSKEWYWLALFVFVFNSAFMLVTSSMMRQFLAMTIVLIAIDFIISKKWYIALLIIYLASLFHTSAIVLLPFSFFGFLNFNLSRKRVLVIFCCYLFFYFFSEILFENTLLKFLEIEPLKRYQVYVSYEPIQTGGSGLGVIYFTILLFFLLLNHKNQIPSVGLIFLLYFLSFFFYMFENIAPIAGRLGYYFSILQIVVYPWLFKTMKKDIWYYLLFSGLIIIIIHDFIVFFDPEYIWHRWFYNYQTIFNAPSWM